MLKFKHEFGHTIEAEVIFLALDSPLSDVQKVLSLDATTFWFNEAREIPKAIVDAATGRVGRYPSVAQGGCTYAGILLDTNSPDTDHWWYTLAERDTSTEPGRQMLESMYEAEQELRAMGALRPDQPLFEFFHQPGGRHKDAENIPNLRPGYYQFAMAGKSKDWIKVYVDGEYGYVQDGRPVHGDYVDSVHCKPCKFVAGRPLIVGMDFGLTPAATFLQMMSTGQWRCIGELCATSMGITRFAGVLKREMQQRFGNVEATFWGDPSGDDRDQDENKAFELLAAEKIIARPAPSQDPSVRREAMAGPLRRMIDGEPGFIIDPSAVMTRKGLAGKFRYRRVQVVGDARFEDKPEKNEFSHPVESAEYGLLGGGENAAIPKGGMPTGSIHVKNDWPVFGRRQRGR